MSVSEVGCKLTFAASTIPSISIANYHISGHQKAWIGWVDISFKWEGRGGDLGQIIVRIYLAIPSSFTAALL
jgi:hypothetical protein